MITGTLYVGERLGAVELITGCLVGCIEGIFDGESEGESVGSRVGSLDA